MDYFMPTRLFTGPDCIGQHASLLKALGGSCIIVTGKHAAKASGALADVEHALATSQIASCVWDGVTENPPVSSCIEAGRYGAENGAAFVVGIGGGSALDAAKAVAVFLTNPTLDEAAFYAKDWANEPAPIVLVGTTAGTGSEVTKVSVLTDAAQRKHSIHDELLYAAVAFGDSRYTHTCSRTITLTTGIDVLAHATESYFSRKADEISRAFAVRAIRQAWKPLAIVAAGDELDEGLRRQMYEASILGGLAINTSSTCFPHNVGYYLTENYDVPHGFACGIFLPAMLAMARTYDPAYAAAFYEEIGSDEERYVTLIEQCLPANTIRMSEREIAEALPRWENNGSVNNTRADVSVEDIRQILSELFAGQ